MRLNEDHCTRGLLLNSEDPQPTPLYPLSLLTRCLLTERGQCEHWEETA